MGYSDVMGNSSSAQRARWELDRQIQDPDGAVRFRRPNRGWAKAIREALDMSQGEMADRLGISQPAVARLEAREADGSASIASLTRLADALGCELVYAFVPRKPSGSLQDIVEHQARQVAQTELAPVVGSMDLEGQSLDDERMRERVESRTALIIAKGRQWKP